MQTPEPLTLPQHLPSYESICPSTPALNPLRPTSHVLDEHFHNLPLSHSEGFVLGVFALKGLDAAVALRRLREGDGEGLGALLPSEY